MEMRARIEYILSSHYGLKNRIIACIVLISLQCSAQRTGIVMSNFIISFLIPYLLYLLCKLKMDFCHGNDIPFDDLQNEIYQCRVEKHETIDAHIKCGHWNVR